jgi:glycosyltransferase involved in cell wall biosynthesis
MLKNKTISVVIPCYNEEKQITNVISTIPDFVDMIIVIDDKSIDNTTNIVKKIIDNTSNKYQEFIKISPTYSKNTYDKALNILIDIKKEEEKYYIKSDIYTNKHSKIILISHHINNGVGSAIASGYKYARDYQIDVSAVMAGDGQMDPSELESICMPVVDNQVDYCKGNRLIHKSAKYFIPKIRYFGNSILSILTKIASGYWRISDTQTGFTAISINALNHIDIHKIYKSYGMPNDLLVKLNIQSFSIKEVEIKPIYNIGEKSKMQIIKVIPKISLLLIKLFIQRMIQKYLINNFHPLFLLYFIAFITFFLNIFIGFKFWSHYIDGDVMYGHLILHTFLSIFSFQSFIFAMWFDMQDNEKLYKL